MAPYYVWPPLAVALVSASFSSWSRVLSTGYCVVGVTWLTNVQVPYRMAVVANQCRVDVSPDRFDSQPTATSDWSPVRLPAAASWRMSE